MAYLIQWDNQEKNVILQQYTDKPIKNDLYHLAQASATMLSSVPHIVHLIIDESRIKLNLTFADMRYLEKYVPSNQGTVVIVVSKNDLNYKKVVQDVGRTIAPIAFVEPYFATSVEAARRLLQEKFEVNYP